MITSIPETMSAVVLTGHGGLDMLEHRTAWPVPTPKKGEALVRVGACGINNTDINTRTGWYDDSVSSDTGSGGQGGFETVDDSSTGGWGNSGITFPRIQGADIAGTVVGVGKGVDQDWIGARVLADNWLRDWSDPMNRDRCGYVGSECDGGFAEYVALPITNLGRITSTWSDAELATLSCSYTTAENMLDRARVIAEDVVLVTGASGGVGSALIQLAKRRGATVIALTSQNKEDAVRAIGPDDVIVRSTADSNDWGKIIRAVSGRETVSVAADVVGAPLIPQLLAVLGRGGRYVTSGAIGGKKVELDLSHLYLNDWEFIGSTVTTPDIFPRIISYVENNEIRPLLAKTYPLDEIHWAQMRFLEKKHVGSLVMVPN